MKKLFSVLLALVLVLSFSLMTAVPVAAEGDIVFSNYPEASGDYDVWVDNSIPPEVIEEFITNDNPGGQWEVTGIRLNAYGAGILGGGGTAQVTISIYTDAVGTSVVKDWDTTFESLEMGDDFSLPVTGVTLDANTIYWFGLETTSGSIGWQQTTGGSHVFELTGNPTVEVVEVKADILKDSGVPGKGLDKASGLQKPFNPDSKAGEHAGKK